jgi:hypothetical protein
MDLSQLGDDLPNTDYIDGLVDIFIEQWNMSRPKRRSSWSKLK